MGTDTTYEYEKVGLDEGTPMKGSPVVTRTEWRDKPFAIAFVLHLLLVLGLMGGGAATFFAYKDEALDAYEDDDLQDFFPPFTLNYALGFLGVTAVSGAVCGAYALLYLKLMKVAPKPMVYISMGFSIVLFLAMGVLFIAFGGYIFGAFFIVLALLSALLYFLWRKRMAFTAKVLETTMQVLEYQSLNYFVAFGGLVAYFVWFIVFTLAVVLSASYSYVDDYLMGAVLIYLIFSWYWTMQVVRNVVHVTIAGAVASWYFQADASPTDATKNALRRACTTSFGSICFGSLIVAIIETLRTLAESGKNQNNLITCLAKCILYCLESLMKLFNKFAFTNVAIYGHSYIEACKATLELLSHSGLRVIMTDILVGNVIMMGAFVGSMLSCLVAVGLAYALTPEYPYLAVLIGITLGYGLVVCSLEVVDSAITSLMVCLCTQPQTMATHFPALYEELRVKYGGNAACGVFQPGYAGAL